MFKQSQAFSSFSTNDLSAAKKFYSEILGLDVFEETAMGILIITLATGGKVMIYPKEDHAPATYTMLNFPVENIDEAVDELTKKGVTFEQYDIEGMKTDEKGISRSEQGPKGMAWCKDPAGNILGVMQEK